MAVDISQILGALNQFGQSNRMIADRMQQNQERRGGVLGTVGAIGGGLLGSIGGPAGAMAGASIGGLVGRGLGGGQISADDIIKTGAQAYGAYQTGQQQKAQGALTQSLMGPAIQQAQSQADAIKVLQGDPTVGGADTIAPYAKAAQERLGVLQSLANPKISGMLSPQAFGVLAHQYQPQMFQTSPGQGVSTFTPGLLGVGGSGGINEIQEAGAYRALTPEQAKAAGYNPNLGTYTALFKNDGTMVGKPTLISDVSGSQKDWVEIATQHVKDDPELSKLPEGQKTELIAKLAARGREAEKAQPRTVFDPVSGKPAQQPGVNVPNVFKPVATDYLNAAKPKLSTATGSMGQPLPKDDREVKAGPVPQDEAKRTENAITMMGELTKFSQNLGATGLIVGNANKMLNLAGWGSDESKQNEAIEPNLVRLGNEIFGKRITNFDLNRIDAMIPHVGAPEEVNKVRIDTISRIVRPAIANDIQRFKQGKFELTDQMKQYADAVGLDPNKITKADLKQPKLDQKDWDPGTKLNPRIGSGDGGKFSDLAERNAKVKVGEYYIGPDGKIAQRTK